MPDVSTPRFRDVTISGGGVFGLDSAAVFTPTWDIGSGPHPSRRRWQPWASVTYWSVPVQVFISASEGFLATGGSSVTPSVTLTIQRAGSSKSVTVNGTPYTQGPYIEPARSALQYFAASSGSFTFSEVAHCVQHVNPAPYEVRTPVSFTCSASITAQFSNTLGTDQTITASLTMTDADISGWSSLTYPAGNYEYDFGFTGTAVHFDTSASIAFSSPGLISTYSGINTTFGKPQLTGGGSSVAFHWNGGESDINAGWDGAKVPSASLAFLPSWAFEVDSTVYKYAGGSVPATVMDMCGPEHVADFTAGSLYRYPGSGLEHWLNLAAFDSGQLRNGFGFQHGSPVSTDSNYDPAIVLAGNNYGPIAQLFGTPLHPTGGRSFPFSPTWANGYGTYADSLHPGPGARLYEKVLQPYQAGKLTWSTTHRFGLFDANTAASGGPRWVADSSPPAFPGAAPLDTAPSISLVSGGPIAGSALQVVCNGSASVNTGLRYLLLHQGYRYGRLRLMCDTPSTTLTTASLVGATTLSVASSAAFHAGDAITVGPEAATVASVASGSVTLTAGLTTAHPSGTTMKGATAGKVLLSLTGSAAGSRAFLITPPSPGTWFTFEFDFCRASHKAGLGATSWIVDTDFVPPYLFAPDPVPSGGWFGAEVAVLPLAAGTYQFDYLEGYYKTDGDRTPILFFGNLDGRGDTNDLAEYSRPDLISITPDHPVQVFTWVVNGARGATVVDFANIQDTVTKYWQKVGSLYDTTTTRPMADGHLETNDTGLTVEIGTLGDPDPLMVFPVLGGGQFAFSGSYGVMPTPGTALTVHGQLRNTSNIAAYYGAGDLMAASAGYDPVVKITADWLFDGEAIVQTQLPGASVSLNDNDSGTVLSTDACDDDGMARLSAHYGVLYPYDNTDHSAEWFATPPISTTISAAFVLPGDTDIPVVDSSGFHVGDPALIGGGETVTVTAVTTGHLTVTPAVTMTYSSGDTVEIPGSDSVGWTALGLNLNTDWLSGDVTPRDGGGYWSTSEPPVKRYVVVILDRYQNFLYPAGSRQGAGVWNMHDRLGAYHRASIESGKIRYRRADLGTPPFVISVDATAGPADTQPRMAWSAIDRVHLLFVRGSDVLLTTSDDDGATWSDPVALFTGAKHPHNCSTDIGTVIHAAYVSGQIHAKEEFAPGQFSDPWTFNDAGGTALTLDDDTFCFSLAREGAARYVLVLNAAGTVKEYASADDCRTWTVVP